MAIRIVRWAAYYSVSLVLSAAIGAVASIFLKVLGGKYFAGSYLAGWGVCTLVIFVGLVMGSAEKKGWQSHPDTRD